MFYEDFADGSWYMWRSWAAMGESMALGTVTGHSH